MAHAAVRILHLEPGEDAGELGRLLATARSIAAEDLAQRFRVAGTEDVAIERGVPDERSFGARARSIVGALHGGNPAAGAGLILLGSGSIVFAEAEDLRALLAMASSGQRRALTNNRYSSDVIALGDASVLADVPDLRGDNSLPRWLSDEAGVEVEELPGRDRLAFDIDSPLDLELLRRDPRCPPALVALARTVARLLARLAEALDALAELARDPRAELLITGRLSASMLRRVEERTACRIRAFVEERGLRTAAPGQRPAASALGLLLDRDGPEAIGSLVARLADGAIIDSRVLLAHRFGADETGWPSAEDRFASDLLLADRVSDPWLRQLTLHAGADQAPIALGAHSLVGPGLVLALGLEA